eukprot:3492683-Pleurochrysis_carterae.AAC.1
MPARTRLVCREAIVARWNSQHFGSRNFMSNQSGRCAPCFMRGFSPRWLITYRMYVALPLRLAST